MYANSRIIRVFARTLINACYYNMLTIVQFPDGMALSPLSRGFAWAHRKHQSSSSTNFFASRMNWRNWRRSSMASRVYIPCFNAFLLPLGAPLPGAPPCMRQRFLPVTAGERHGFPLRVFAPHRWLASMGAVLRLCVPAARVFTFSHLDWFCLPYRLKNFAGFVFQGRGIGFPIA